MEDLDTANHGSINVDRSEEKEEETESLTSPVSSADVQRSRFSLSLKAASSLSTKQKFFVGLIIVGLIAVSWMGTTQTAKSTFNQEFTAPAFVMYFSTVWEILVFPIVVPFFFLSGSNCKKGTCTKLNREGLKELWTQSTLVFSERGITCKSFVTLTVPLALIWAGTNYMYARALMIISATDVTALFSSAPFFVFLFSICVLKEPPLVLRFIAVVVAITGIVLFAYADGFGTANKVGVLLSVGSAVGAATYKVLLKWRIGDASPCQMALFLSSLGLFVAVILLPVVLLLHFLGVEKIENVPWGYLCASSALGLLFNFSINFGIAYTFPLFISLGTILGIPLNALIDAVCRHDKFFSTWKFTATDLIVGGFLLLLVPPADSEWIQNLFINLARNLKKD